MLKKSIIALNLFCLSLFAQTTMCFKQNHENLLTIESTKLSGGECNLQKSAADMKNEGWTISDIKMMPGKNGIGTDFIYVFAKGSTSVQDEEALMAKLYAKIKQEEEDKKEEEKQEIILQNSKAGETFFKKQCASCHGEKGERLRAGLLKPIKDLSHDKFQLAIREYTQGERNGSTAMIMMQYANLLNNDDVRNIYTYLKYANQEQEE